MASDVIITFDFESSDSSQKKVVNQAQDTGKKAGKKAGKSFSVGFDSGLSSLKKQLIGVGAAVAGAFTFKEVIGAAAKIETLSTQFTTLLGSAGAARVQMEKLAEFSAATPFELEEIAQASKSLLAFGFSQEDSIKKLGFLGDAAAASGESLKDLTKIFGQVKGASKLTGERLAQLVDRSIPIGSALANSMGVAESSIQKMVSQGKVSFKDFEKAFQSLSDTGGSYEDGMKKLSKTVDGLTSTLKSDLFLAFGKIGKAIEPITKTVLKDLILKVKEFKESFDFNQLVIDAIEFGIAINDYVVAPFVVFKRTAFAVFKAVQLGFQTLLTGLVNHWANIINALNIGGALDEIAGPLNDFAEVTKDNLVAMADETSDAFGNILEPNEFANKSAEYLEQLRATAIEANKINAEVKPPKGTPDPDEVKKDVISLKGLMKEVSSNFKTEAGSMAKTTADMAKSVSSSLLKGLGTGISTSFAALGSALAKGEDAMEAFGKAMLGVIGDIAINLGNSFIAQGIAHSLNPLTPGAGAGLIGAGIGLSVIGGAIKALGSGGVGATSSPAGGGGVASDTTTAADTTVAAEEPEELETRVASTAVNVNIQGDVLDSESTGLRIVDMLNDAFDKQGVTLSNNASFA